MLSTTGERSEPTSVGKIPLSKLDLTIVASFSALAALLALWGFSQLGTSLEREVSFDIWFQADTPRVIANLTDAQSNYYRMAVHPAASILLTSIVLGLIQLGVEPLAAARFLVLVAGGLSAGLFFVVLRFLDLPRSVSSLFTFLFVSSASYLHWTSVIELNMAAGFTIVLALAALAYGRTRNPFWWVLVSAATLSVTITNWSIGLISTLVRWPRGQFLSISGAALGLVVLLALMQHFTFNKAPVFFWPHALVGEVLWTQPAMESRGAGDWNPFASLSSLVVTTIVAPAPEIELQGGEEVITNQHAGFTGDDWEGIAAAVAWLALVGLGIWGGVRSAPVRPVFIGLALILLSQALLHSVYGDPTFLFAPHFLPVLVALASLSWFTPLRWLVVALAVVVSVFGGFNNVQQFRAAAAIAIQIVEEGGNPVNPMFPAKGALLPAPVTR